MNGEDNNNTATTETAKEIVGFDKNFDFPLPLIVKNTIEDTEAALLEDGPLGPYMNWIDTLDNVCKECYVTHALTRAQWNEIIRRCTVDDEY